MIRFGERLKQLRIEHQWTQQELIDQFNKMYHYNLGKSAISQYENNKRIPEVHVLMNFAEFFGVSLDYLMGKTNVRHGSVKEYSSTYHTPTDADNIELNQLVNEFIQFLTQRQLCLNHQPVPKKNVQFLADALEIALELVKHLQYNDE